MIIEQTGRGNKLNLRWPGKTKNLLIAHRYMCPTCERLLAAGAPCPVGHDLAGNQGVR